MTLGRATRRSVTWLALAGFALFFFVHTFRPAWTEVHTDFPNYYTAAVLARKHAPLERYYDWPWFQRQMNYAGWGMQLGGYIPQTPLTMLPLVPLSGLPPMAAKRAWLVLNLLFCAGAILLLSRAGKVSATFVLMLLFLGYYALHMNFLLGQYYVFLLFLLAAGAWCLVRGKAFAGGVVMGAACMLKLYTAPLLLYFAWKRQWRSFAGMAVACTGLALLSIAWFGWHANVYFVQGVLRPSMEGMILDPYNAGVGTLTQLLRHAFVPEAELNPHPLFAAPFVFFFLRPFLMLGILVLTVMALPRSRSLAGEASDLGWLLVCLFLVTPNLASYVFVLLLLPIALLLGQMDWRSAALLSTVYVLLCWPLALWWRATYPRIWLIAILYLVIGTRYWRNLRWRAVGVALAAVCAVSVVEAWQQQNEYARDTPARFEAVATEPGSIYASHPAVSMNGVVFEGIADGRYLLKRWTPQGRIDLSRFEGFAFHPSVPFAQGTPITFELVAQGHSQLASLDANGRVDVLTPAEYNAMQPAVSPDARELAFISHGALMVRSEGAPRRLSVPGPVTDVAWYPGGDRLAVAVGAEGQGRVLSLDVHSGTFRELTRVAGDQREPAISPDGVHLAFTVSSGGFRQIWTQNLLGGAPRQITTGACNSFGPAWEADSVHLLFASDCRRGIGLPRLFRARVPKK